MTTRKNNEAEKEAANAFCSQMLNVLALHMIPLMA